MHELDGFLVRSRVRRGDVGKNEDGGKKEDFLDHKPKMIEARVRMRRWRGVEEVDDCR